MTDDAFLSAFEACTLDPQHFNHRGHVRLAWLYLQRYPFDEAVTRATHLGAAGARDGFVAPDRAPLPRIGV
jgi:hypothetical protein